MIYLLISNMDNTINFKVRDLNGNDVAFMMFDHHPLSRMMEAYCSRQGLAHNSVIFKIGDRILMSNELPKNISNFGNGTIISVY
jgi:hypothetical protein